MAIQDESLPGWVFRVEEVSASVFEVSARGPGGRSISGKGTDPVGLLEKCKEDARGMEKGKGRMRAGLREFLDSRGVRRDSYSLDEAWCDECYRLEQVGSDWIVYYAERGLRSGQRQFDSEDDACDYLLNRLLSDPSTRTDP